MGAKYAARLTMHGNRIKQFRNVIQICNRVDVRVFTNPKFARRATARCNVCMFRKTSHFRQSRIPRGICLSLISCVLSVHDLF